MEYNGEQHYLHIPYSVHARTVHFVHNRDKEKRDKCEKNGITLINIPYWWDLKKESVLELLSRAKMTIDI